MLRPQDYNAASSRPRFQRPVAVSLLAALGVVVGSLLFFCNVIAMVAETIMLAHPERSRPMMSNVPQDPLVIKFGAANALVCVIFAAILLGGSLAAIRMHRIGRQMILIWSLGFILCGIGRTIGEIQYVGPANVAWVEHNKPEEPTYRSGQMEAAIVPKAIAILLLYCILPVLFLIFWTRKDVKEAFDRGGIMP
jgi:hypothetical protein